MNIKAFSPHFLISASLGIIFIAALYIGTAGNISLLICAGLGAPGAVWVHSLQTKQALRTDDGALLGVVVGIAGTLLSVSLMSIFERLDWISSHDTEFYRQLGMSEEQIEEMLDDVRNSSFIKRLSLLTYAQSAIGGLLGGFAGAFATRMNQSGSVESPTTDSTRLPARVQTGLILAGISIVAFLAIFFSYAPLVRSTDDMPSILFLFLLFMLAGLAVSWLLILVGCGFAFFNIPDHSHRRLVRGVSLAIAVFISCLFIYGLLMMPW